MYNNNYNARVVPEFMAYGGTPVGIPTGAVPQNATGGAIPQWALGQQNQNKYANEYSNEIGQNMENEEKNMEPNLQQSSFHRINNTDDFSYLNNSNLNMGLTAASGQTPMKYFKTDLIKGREIVSSPYSNNILENDCYQSDRFEPFAKQVRWNEGEKDNIISATPTNSRVDQNTKYGISNAAYNSFKSKYQQKDSSYPDDVLDLTEDQGMNLQCQEYYKPSRAEAINDANLAFAYYDSFFNAPENAVNSWQQALKNTADSSIQVGGGVGSATINAFNKVQKNKSVYDKYWEYRKPTIQDKYIKGIYNRFKTYK